MLRQKQMLAVNKTFENNIMHRPVLGIFKLHAQIDILEIQALLKQASQGLKPKNIDLMPCFACFGHQTFFSVMKDHLRILDALRVRMF